MLYLVNKVVTLACLHFNSPGHCSLVKLLVCLHSPAILPPFSSPIQHLKCLLLPLRLLKARELEEEAKEWSVSSPLHFYDQQRLSGLQPTDLGTGTSEQAPSATAIPEARRQAGAGALRWCSGEYECICVWVYHPELLGRVLHFNEASVLTGSARWNAFSVFTQFWSRAMQQVPVFACVCDIACTHMLKFKLTVKFFSDPEREIWQTSRWCCS